MSAPVQIVDLTSTSPRKMPTLEELHAAAAARAQAKALLLGRLSLVDPELNEVIDALKFETIKTLVKEACVKDSAVKNVLRGMLLVNGAEVRDVPIESEDGESSEEEDDDNPDSPTPPIAAPTSSNPLNKKRKASQPLIDHSSNPQPKRLKPRYALCHQCKEQFDVTENYKRACSWHPGELDVDWDGGFWADHDENCHGPIDMSRLDEYPEGFQRDCCEGDGESEGCKETWHRR